jgi:hypothetical protein
VSHLLSTWAGVSGLLFLRLLTLLPYLCAVPLSPFSVLTLPCLFPLVPWIYELSAISDRKLFRKAVSELEGI